MAELVTIVGRLRRLRRRPGGSPEHPIAPEEEPIDPGYGIEEGAEGFPDQPLPEPPPGIWPGPTPGHPIVPVPPGTPENPIALPPGMIWPPPSRPEHPIQVPPQKALMLVYVPGYGVKYVVVDPSLRPTPKK